VARATRFRDLPLVWKLLLPFVTLMLFAGTIGAFVIVRDLSSRAETNLDSELARRSLAARSVLHDRELYLVESANLAANLRGMSTAARGRDARRVRGLVRSVLALKTDLTFVAVIDRKGRPLAEFRRDAEGRQPKPSRGTPRAEIVRKALHGQRTGGGFARTGSQSLLVVAAPICPGVRRCIPLAVAVAGIDVGELATEAARASSSSSLSGAGASILDERGTVVARAGLALPETSASSRPSGYVRRLGKVDGRAVGAELAPFAVQGHRIGTLGVVVPTDPIFSAARGTAWRLGLILLVVTIGVLAIGAMLSRTILAQVRPLVETNRRLAGGDLAARTPVLGADELGELATGVNHMALELQRSHETLEERVRERTAEVERLLRERTDFFTGISHDFRTPLAVILSQADMLLDPEFPTTDELARDVGRAMKGSAAQLLARINDIVEIARAESGNLDLDLVPVRVGEVFEDLRQSMEGLARGSDLDFTVGAAEVPTVTADPLRLHQILLNLVDNAIKYTPAGGRVEVSARHEGREVVLSVSDTGVGIPLEVGARVFEPFFRVKAVRPQRGEPSSGLGLALTRRLVEAHGGEIGFAARPGGGSVFSFTLPVAGVAKEVRPNGLAAIEGS
jgi:signal transduction histidine kinase